jgi:hypothetical protein
MALPSLTAVGSRSLSPNLKGAVRRSVQLARRGWGALRQPRARAAQRGAGAGCGTLGAARAHSRGAPQRRARSCRAPGCTHSARSPSLPPRAPPGHAVALVHEGGGGGAGRVWVALRLHVLHAVVQHMQEDLGLDVGRGQVGAAGHLQPSRGGGIARGRERARSSQGRPASAGLGQRGAGRPTGGRGCWRAATRRRSGLGGRLQAAGPPHLSRICSRISRYPGRFPCRKLAESAARKRKRASSLCMMLLRPRSSTSAGSFSRTRLFTTGLKGLGPCSML